MIIAFDLDGTLSDPIEGIAASINHALEALGFDTREQKNLEKYIGPPLTDIFTDLLGEQNRHLVSDAIGHFRQRYFKTGFMENILYPGIRKMLSTLTDQGHTLYIATAKKEEIAVAVARYFDITGYFKAVYGSGLSRQKQDLLKQIQAEENSSQLVMIGDRRHDMSAGKACDCACIGVLWGYGSQKELLDAGAHLLCDSPAAVPATINRLPL